VSRRSILVSLAVVLTAVPVVWFAVAWLRYPSDRTPNGAYLRVMSAVNRGKPEAFFAYIETVAQHACYTIRDYRKKSVERARETYPEPERSELVERYQALASAEDGSDVFALYARTHGFMDRLRRDLSAVSKIEVDGDRASVETVRGTRYPFRRRDNGIWGLTSFTATLVAEAEKAARDHALIEQAARDYARAKRRPAGQPRGAAPVP
jgi:hypothetical protein